MNENVIFNDICTDFTCSALANELIKFLLYNKQQIPISYDKLHYALTRHESLLNTIQIGQKRCFQSEKLLRSAKEGIGVLQEVFDRLSELFSHNLHVSEMALIFGGSLLTPKQVYRFNFPRRELGHLPRFHRGQAIMNDLLQYIVGSDDLSRLLSQPMEPTNLFVLLKVQQGSQQDMSWFLHKPRYTIPTFGQNVHVTLDFKAPECAGCTCKGFSIYSDDGEESPVTVDKVPPAPPVPSPPPTDMTWYQMPLIFKGFKDSYVQGVSLSKSWMTDVD